MYGADVIMMQFGTIYAVKHWVKRTINGHENLFNKMVNIYYSLSDYYSWFDSLPHYIVPLCVWLRCLPVSEDTIGLGIITPNVEVNPGVIWR